MTENDIKYFLIKKNYDLRISNYGRWIDQKCTPDVLWSISDFILQYSENIADIFTVTDIWHSEYAKQTIKETFSKPETDDSSAENEYDKVFSQPMNLLCYAGVIEDISQTNRHLYRVAEKQVLEYIARNDVYALRFLQEYIEKVLRDSNFMADFEHFLQMQTNENYHALKMNYLNFCHHYTNIKGRFEPFRIFSKVLNPLAFKYDKRGTIQGRMSKNIINRSDMMYNRDNFRDIYSDKPKGVSRNLWRQQHPEFDIRPGYFQQQMNASKRLIRTFNDNNRNCISELTQFDQNHTDEVLETQIHHIFPKNEFPDIMHYIENLIALTPNQHFGFAHPKNNTQIIDSEAQRTLLIAKTHSIEKNLVSEYDKIYDFNNFLIVLSTGWNDDDVLEIPQYSYNDVIHSINYHYD